MAQAGHAKQIAKSSFDYKMKETFPIGSQFTNRWNRVLTVVGYWGDCCVLVKEDSNIYNITVDVKKY